MPDISQIIFKIKCSPHTGYPPCKFFCLFESFANEMSVNKEELSFLKKH
jgi:hypothetical protein